MEGPCRNHYGQAFAKWQTTSQHRGKWEDNPVYGNYYDNRNVPHKRVQYAEGVFVGYRGYDRNGKQPLYPFGYGLSYSSFEYSNLSVEKTGKPGYGKL